MRESSRTIQRPVYSSGTLSKVIFIWDGIHLPEDGRGVPGSHTPPPALLAAVQDLRRTLTGRPPGPIVVPVDRFWLHGHALGEIGHLVCGFPDAPGAAYRSYATGLGLLTDGRLRLVTHQEFYGQDRPGQLLLQGPVDTVPAAQLLLFRLRALLPKLAPRRQALHYELAFAELAANTLRYGSRGHMAVYRENRGLSILAEDHGPGIPLYLLPNSLLLSGYTTTPGSLGAGYPTVIKLSESTTLATGDQGTSVLVRLKSV